MKLLNEYEYKIPKIWFYEIKGVQDVATVEEIKTAKNLTSSRSKIFLETRAYLRQSLSTLFNLNSGALSPTLRAIKIIKWV